MNRPTWLDALSVGEDARRVVLWLAVSMACGLTTLRPDGAPDEFGLVVGEVAPRTVRASHTFQYTDFAGREAAVTEAKASVRPVFVRRVDLVADLNVRISEAFQAGRAALPDAADGDLAPSIEAFRATLGVHLPDDDVRALAAVRFPDAAERLTQTLLARALSGDVIADRAELPPSSVPLQIIDLGADGMTERTVVDRASIRTPTEAREQVSMGLLEAKVPAAPWVDAAAMLARASVRANLSFDVRETRAREQAAAAEVVTEATTVKRGAILFRQGDLLTDTDLSEYRALQSSAAKGGPWAAWGAASALFALLTASLYQLGSARLSGFSGRVRDAAAAGALLVATAFTARAVVAVSGDLAPLVGLDVQAASLWFAVPAAGAVILVRLLIGAPWAALFAVAAAAVCGVIMEFHVLHAVVFLATGAVAAAAVEHTRERMAVVRAGAMIGVVGAAAALLAHLVEVFVAGDVGLEVTIRPLWSMVFAFLGGVASSFVALGLMPLFESLGFVTDYRLMELANLNHPLLRQLMLRAPGTYHHSVIVGSLAEAACEAIGANALQARVAAYFHDVGKSIKPQYFVENQRGGGNRHDSMEPLASARVIVAHVIEGGRMAREHKLPQPIVDNIFMHHGDGLLPYFYERAVREANGEPVDERAFRYPGPKPDSREAGVIMLADKVEAATRTIREPTEDAFRAMILKIVNSVVADNQFEKCPLTFQEIHVITETFVKVLLGIHHQRVEYPATTAISRGVTEATEDPKAARRGSVITLELPSVRRVEPLRTGTDGALPPSDLEELDETTDPDTDYESIQNLPKGGGKL